MTVCTNNFNLRVDLDPILLMKLRTFVFELAVEYRVLVV